MNNLDVGDILAKEQFKVKLGFTYFLTSGWNLVLLMIFLSGISLTMAISLYLFLAVVAYKFLFTFTKNGEFYEPYAYKNLVKFIRLIHLKIQKEQN